MASRIIFCSHFILSITTLIVLLIFYSIKHSIYVVLRTAAFLQSWIRKDNVGHSISFRILISIYSKAYYIDFAVIALNASRFVYPLLLVSMVFSFQMEKK